MWLYTLEFVHGFVMSHEHGVDTHFSQNESRIPDAFSLVGHVDRACHMLKSEFFDG